MLLHLITHYGLVVLVASVAAGQAGLPLPAYPLLLLAGSLAQRGRLNLALAFALGLGACLLADGFRYQVGRRYGSRVLRIMCSVSLSPDGCVRQTESIFTRWGPPALMLAKFIPGFASVATTMAGSTRVRPASFFVFAGLGAALWVGSGLALGWLFASAINEALAVLQRIGEWSNALLIGLVAGYIGLKALRRRAFHARLRMDRISVHDLADLFHRGEAPLVVDVRKTLGADDARIPGAVVFSDDDWPQDLRPADEQALVVVYCACPNEASAALVAKKLMDRGFKRVRPLAGGIDAWRAAGLALEPADGG
ncbi:MAG: VTT domain-containing protein [Burkholderiales bacterium]|nr:VTT domain-containing protein [Burkholderiales bacterium]